jgi:GNAT superfamily N-acetyltransferase
LAPGFIGKGLGKWLLTRAVQEAWVLGATRVWLHTCTLDHPSALANYQARGFAPYLTEQYTADD